MRTLRDFYERQIHSDFLLSDLQLHNRLTGMANNFLFKETKRKPTTKDQSLQAPSQSSNASLC